MIALELPLFSAHDALKNSNCNPSGDHDNRVPDCVQPRPCGGTCRAGYVVVGWEMADRRQLDGRHHSPETQSSSPGAGPRQLGAAAVRQGGRVLQPRTPRHSHPGETDPREMADQLLARKGAPRSNGSGPATERQLKVARTFLGSPGRWFLTRATPSKCGTQKRINLQGSNRSKQISGKLRHSKRSAIVTPEQRIGLAAKFTSEALQFGVER